MEQGWSFGGVLAFEVALQLRDLGHQVEGIILIDSPYPVNHEPIPEAVIQHITSAPPRFGVSEKLRKYVITQFELNAAMLGKYFPAVAEGLDIPIVMLTSRDNFDTESLCHIPYPWLCSKLAREEEIKRWGSLVRRSLSVLEIPGNHFEPFERENVSCPPANAIFIND